MPEKSTQPIYEFYARDRKTWRTWLQKNHTKEKNVWLILHNQKSHTPSVTYPDAIEEAPCFGWIDSTPPKRNGESCFQLFAQRKPKSNWSKLNRERAEKMIAQEKMAKAGMAMIELAIKSGTWTRLEDVQNSVIPPDLAQAFGKNKTAFKYFQAFPPSSKRIILEWILNAKQLATRQKRISETVTLAAKTIKANHWRQ
jgi:uncharacterized protein YdeI (YjbR/CyaY-like superfamily)